MRPHYPVLDIERIERLSPMSLDSCKRTAAQDKTHFRRREVNRLRLRGYTNKQIADQIGCNLSTIEKDLHAIRETSRQWYEEDSIIDYCESLHTCITQYDNAIEDLHILYKNESELENKLKILTKITDFEDRKRQLYEKTAAVARFVQTEVSSW